MFYVFYGILCLLCYHTLVANKTETATVKEKKQRDLELKDYNWTVWCKFQPNGYDCDKPQVSRFYYDIKMEGCKSFTHAGCPTTFNSFVSLSECNDACRDPGLHAIKFNLTDKAACRLQPDFGQCDGYYPMFYFDITHRTCKGFSYSGCGGNYNRYANPQICSAVCSSITQF